MGDKYSAGQGLSFVIRLTVLVLLKPQKLLAVSLRGPEYRQ